jgi:DNA-binding beta-propeller fold protein YncE
MKKLLFLLLPVITLSAQVVDTVIRFSDQPFELLYIPEGNELYVNFPGNNYFFVLDCSTFTIKKIISRPTGYPSAAYGVWNWRRNKIYYAFNNSPDSIAVIDNRTDSIIKWINFHSSRSPCYNSKDDKVYAFGGSRGVAVIDCATDSIIKIITQPHPLSGFVLWDSIGNKVYCGSGVFYDKVTVINCVNDSVVAVISTNVFGSIGAVSNFYRRKLYFGSLETNVGAVIDEVADTLIKNYQSIFYDFEIPLIWNSLEDKVYWPNYDTIYVINCQNDSIIKNVELPRFGFNCMCLTTWSNRLYVSTDAGDFNTLYALDCRNDSVISHMRFGKNAISIERNPQNHRIYISDEYDSALYVFKDEIQGIEERKTLDTIRSTLEVYPNPAGSVIRVRVPLSIVGGVSQLRLKIFDVSGELIREIATSADGQTRNDNGREIKMSLKGISPGIYFLQLGTEIKKFLVIK